MQSAWDKYLDFDLQIIELVEDATLLDEREQVYIDLYYNDINCMNLASCAKSPGRGRILSEEERSKISAFHKGRVHSPEHMAKISAALSKQVKVTYPNGYFDIFSGATEAGLKFGVGRKTINNYCTGKSPQPGTGRDDKRSSHISGYIFEYEQTPCH
jgi:hypothetical protein